MAGSVKAPDAVELEVFFDGVAEMRAHLDRSLQDPERRRARLAAIAADLLKPRDARELGRWLVSEVATAIGAAAAAIIVRERAGHFVPWHTVGTPPIARLAEAVAGLAGAAHPVADPADAGGDGVFVPLVGLEGLVGALWLSTRTALDPGVTELLGAIADATGVRLEQGLLLEAMA